MVYTSLWHWPILRIDKTTHATRVAGNPRRACSKVMPSIPKNFILCSIGVILFVLPTQANARIYTHVNKDGSLHYSDSPVNPSLRKAALPEAQIRFLEYSGERVQFDVYDPGLSGGPAAILIHGSAGITGDRAERYRRFAMDLAGRGILAVNVHYFDSPRQQWVQTILETIRYLPQIAKVDENRIALIGYSLGGSLAVEASLKSEAVKVLVVKAGALPRNFSKGHVRQLPRKIYMACGTKDFCYPSLQTLTEWTRGTGISLTTDIRPGAGHAVPLHVFWEEWRRVVDYVAENL